MPIAAIISTIIATGLDVAPRIIAFFQELHNGEVPTQAQIDDVWSRHTIAKDAILGEDPSTHPGG